MPISLPASDADYFSEKTKTLIRSNKEYLLQLCIEQPILEPEKIYANRYDFYKVLRSLNVDNRLHWIIAFLNDVIDPNAYVDNLNSLLLIDINNINILIASNNSQHQ